MHGLSEHWSVHSNFKEYIEANTDIDGVHLIDVSNVVFHSVKCTSASIL